MPSILVHAAEFHPSVAYAPLVATQQQIPGHLFAGIAVGLDARRLEVRIEKKRQGQRQHFRLAGAVVAPQQQAAVAEPEFFAVIVEKLDQPQSQRLPTGEGRDGQCRGSRIGHSNKLDWVAERIGARMSVSPSAKRASAGSG